MVVSKVVCLGIIVLSRGIGIGERSNFGLE